VAALALEVVVADLCKILVVMELLGKEMPGEKTFHKPALALLVVVGAQVLLVLMHFQMWLVMAALVLHQTFLAQEQLTQVVVVAV
jgi:hypothetical protein